MTTDRTTWVKASRSNGDGACVEMREHDSAVEVRDTKAQGTGPSLRVSPTTFADWVQAAKNGELDRLA